VERYSEEEKKYRKKSPEKVLKEKLRRGEKKSC
jgi:hypothetical protein